MKKYKINEINSNEYMLEDMQKQKHNICFNFFDIDEFPQKGEYIYFSEKLLDKVISEEVKVFNFGGISEIYGKDIKKGGVDENLEELLILEKNNKRTYLKRFYG